MADLTISRIPKATGTHQIDDGAITDDGATVNIHGTDDTVIASFYGDATATELDFIGGTSGLAVAVSAAETALATFGTPVPPLNVYVNLTTLSLTIDAIGRVSFPQTVSMTLSDFADDVAAALGGVPVGGLYRTLSIVKVRVA